MHLASSSANFHWRVLSLSLARIHTVTVIGHGDLIGCFGPMKDAISEIFSAHRIKACRRSTTLQAASLRIPQDSPRTCETPYESNPIRGLDGRSTIFLASICGGVCTLSLSRYSVSFGNLVVDCNITRNPSELLSKSRPGRIPRAHLESLRKPVSFGLRSVLKSTCVSPHS